MHVIEEPLSEYLRYELIGYVESTAVGEEIRLADPLEDPPEREQARRTLADFDQEYFTGAWGPLLDRVYTQVPQGSA